ncbi:MAG TPA: PD-(D/E)XK nuclease family protein, partial [Bacillota bacterium]|nr:PD-(D/E)XK nuclease family protein [Bacillota bacterium]
MQKLYNDLTHIQGIKFRKDGSFAETNRLLDESGFKDLLEKVEKQILEAIEQIKSGDFSIDPLPSFGIKKDSVSCEYCQFSHICYNKNKGLGGVEE